MTDVVVAQKSPSRSRQKPAGNTGGAPAVAARTNRSATAATRAVRLSPDLFVAEKSETLWMCGCKHTEHPPFCDGTHESL